MTEEKRLDRIDKALAVLDSDISGYKISKEIDVAESTISRYRSKKIDANVLKLGYIIKLAEFYEKYLK